MKKFKVIIPYMENRKENNIYSIDFEVLAENRSKAKESGIKKFQKFVEFDMASWIRTPIIEDIKVEFIEDVKEPDPWSYL